MNSLHDRAWSVIQHDPALGRAKKVLSIHEFRLIIERIATAMNSRQYPCGCSAAPAGVPDYCPEHGAPQT